ncbi:MAG: FAD-dependent oxidoreductase, partial [Vicinamibacterales bacterium]
MVRSTDIVVIGAGVIGAAVAFELVRRGASVTLVDARTPGHGATQASGGMLAPYTEASEGGPLLALGARSLQLFRPFADAVRHESGLDLSYWDAGSLHLARTETQLAHFEANRTALAAMDVPATMLAAADIRALEPAITTDVLGGLVLPSQAHISASALTHALIVAATRRGATLVESSRVTRVMSEG